MPWFQLPAGGCMACGVWLCQLPGAGWLPNWPVEGVATDRMLATGRQERKGGRMLTLRAHRVRLAVLREEGLRRVRWEG